MPEIEKPKKEETVTVNKAALEKLLADNKETGERLKALEAVADKSRVEWYRGLNPNTKKESEVTLGTYPTAKGFKIIKGWTSLPLNEMYQDTNGAWHERQVMKLILEDNSELDINYIDFVRRKVSVKAKIASRVTDEATGVQTLKVVTVDGKTIEIDSIFINV